MAYAANQEPTGLTALTSLDVGDLIIVGDVSDASEVAKKITKANLLLDIHAAPTFTTSITTDYLTASEIVITNASKQLVSAPVATYPSLTELTYVKGVTSAIQTQLGAKAPAASPTFTGTVTLPTGLTGVLRADSGVVSVEATALVDADIGSTVQAYDADLTTWAGITPGTGVGTALAVDVGSAGAVVTNGGALGTPSGGSLANCADYEGSAIKSTGEAGGTKFLREDGDGTSSWQTVPAGVSDIVDDTTPQLGGDLDSNGKDILLGDATSETSSIILNSTALADEKWSGTTITATAGATLAVGDVCYLASSGKWVLVDGILDGTDTGFDKKLGICVLASTDTNPTEILLDGVIASAAFPAFTVGSPVYLDDTAGDLVVAQPSTTNFAIRIVGYAVSATVLHFSPSNDYIVHV